MNISVIIPVKNDEENIRDSVKSVLNQEIDRDFEVIVADNGSTDGTVDVIEDLPVKILKEEKLSASAVRNTGVKNSQGDVLAFTDSDCIAHEKWLENHLEFHGKGDVVMGRNFLHPGYRKYVISKAQEYGLLPYFDFNFLDEGTEKLEFWNLYTSNLSVKRKVFDEVGLFDEQFRYAGSEDTEFGHRVVSNGYEIFYNPQAKIFHKHANKINSALDRSIRAGRQAKFLAEKVGENPRKNILLKRLKRIASFPQITLPEKLSILFISSILLTGFVYGSLTFKKLYGRSLP